MIPGISYFVMTTRTLIAESDTTARTHPGFERLCVVEAVLRGPFRVAPIRVNSQGKRYKLVEVTPKSFLAGIALTYGTGQHMSGIRRH
jgi:hypothetical protein